MNFRRTRRALTTLSPIRGNMPRRTDNTFSFDDNFVLVFTKAPPLSVQVLDETRATSVPFLKKLVLVGAVLYKGIRMLLSLGGQSPHGI